MSTELLAQALRDIIDPIAYIERNMEEGCRLDGHAALQQISSREFYVRLAREALADHEALAEHPAPQPQQAGVSEVHQAIAHVQRQYLGIVKAAVNLIAACHDRQDNQAPPLKYTIPYGEVNALHDALTAAPAPQAQAVSLDVIAALQRVELKFGRFDDGSPKDWQEWVDFRAALAVLASAAQKEPT